MFVESTDISLSYASHRSQDATMKKKDYELLKKSIPCYLYVFWISFDWILLISCLTRILEKSWSQTCQETQSCSDSRVSCIAISLIRSDLLNIRIGCCIHCRTVTYRQALSFFSVIVSLMHSNRLLKQQNNIIKNQ